MGKIMELYLVLQSLSLTGDFLTSEGPITTRAAGYECC